MESMRATWTDSRLDDLADRVDAGFARVDEDIREMRGEIGSLQRTIIQVGGALGAGFIALLAAMLGLIATQL
jgi:Ni2+-binding GTPase involved in maturation of urease and hydrogenase